VAKITSTNKGDALEQGEASWDEVKRRKGLGSRGSDYFLKSSFWDFP